MSALKSTLTIEVEAMAASAIKSFDPIARAWKDLWEKLVLKVSSKEMTISHS